VHPETAPEGRNEFQRDRDRIVHCGAFRRLEYKTQVFVNHEGDLFRTRLTHSIEVTQIARTIARRLRLHEDLTEAISLAHDLGHTPFGHAGQDALNRCMQPHGGFEHQIRCGGGKAHAAAGEFEARRTRQSVSWMWDLVQTRLMSGFRGDGAVRAALPGVLADVTGSRLAATAAARRLLELYGHP
jgi:hypothetical protein